MIDIHNHIIPGIDDGAVDMSMALQMLEIAQEQGITHLVCTPHMHAGRFNNDSFTIKDGFSRLSRAAAQSGLTIKLAMGAEVRISDEFMFQLVQEKVPFIGEWQERSAVLLEMPHGHIPAGIESSFSVFMADIYHRNVNSYLDYWAEKYQKQGSEFHISASEMTLAVRNAEKAQKWQPDDPKQLLLLAKVLQWRAFLEPDIKLDFRDIPEELDLIRQAVALRPAWPYGWIVLAEAKARHSQIDAEFNQILIQAVTLGPWELQVMEKAARLEVRYRDWLNDRSIIALQLNRERLQKAYPKKAKNI